MLETFRAHGVLLLQEDVAFVVLEPGREQELPLMKPRALIIGGSLGGLFAANFLHDLGWELDVFERVPPLIRPDRIARIKQDASAMLAPHVAEIVERSRPFFQAIFDVESPSLALGRVCLLGDAAFVARRHVGMGVTKAALDARSLAKSIAGSPGELDAALARYARLRGDFGRRCVARARRLGAYIEARSRPEQAWSAEQLDQRPERVLHEVAAALSDIPELAMQI